MLLPEVRPYHWLALANARSGLARGEEVQQGAVQVDFAPTLAALLGVPVPFGNIGRVSWELWALRGSATGYQAALARNARQVKEHGNRIIARLWPVERGMQQQLLHLQQNDCTLQ